MKVTRGSGGLMALAMAMGLLLSACGDSSPVSAGRTDFGPGEPGDDGVSVSSDVPEAPCLDDDGDRYGVGAGCLGLDCDDHDPQLTLVCGFEPPCTGPHDASCPCPAEGNTMECFSSHPGLMGVGLCRGGAQTCRMGFWSPCEGEVGPAPEICDGQDNDCDGQADEGCPGTSCLDPNAPGCPCQMGATLPCFSGNALLRNAGVCREGVQACASGLWSACAGEVLPSLEVCDGQDNDCDGMEDEGFGPGCGGPPTCTDLDGDGYGQGEACVGPDCDDGDPSRSLDCAVNPDCAVPGTQGCPCDAGETLSCSAAIPHQGGVCHEGLRTCRVGFWSPCEGEVLPSLEICDGLDNDCDGEVDEGFPPNCAASCIDLDGDGYGQGAGCLGADCDDGNPALAISCTGDCTVAAPGCPCVGGTAPCYEGPEGTAGRGVCREGTMACEDGLFGPCLGQVVPGEEACNLSDDDCDGEVDEGVQSPCGECLPGCTSVVLDGEGLAQGGTLDGLAPSPDGSLKLSVESLSYGFVWIANSDESTVSKLDAQTGHEVARYSSVLPTPEVATRPVDEDCNYSSRGNCPSRTAVDLNGDVFVANRAFGHQGTVTKIAGDISHCMDRNGDGVISTSEDANGDGRITRSDPLEFMGEEDECLLFTVEVGESNGLPRALAICEGYYAGGGTVWVGTYNDQRATSLDNRDGHFLAQVDDLDIQPYGAVCDRYGSLWLTPWTGDRIVSVNTTTLEARTVPIVSDMPDGCMDTYGICLDGANRVWVNARRCEGAYRYDPVADDWMTVHLPGWGRGRGITADAQGRVWLGHSHNRDDSIAWGHISSFNAEDGSDPVLYDVPGAEQTVGVGLDFFGNMWGVNRGTNNASRINPATGEMEVFPVGRGPYTYSDFTGFILRTFVAPRGIYHSVIVGCDEGPTDWRSLAWDATVYPETSVMVRYRLAPTAEELAGAAWSEAVEVSPVDLSGLGDHGFLEVEIILESQDDLSSPLLHGVEALFVCGG